MDGQTDRQTERDREIEIEKLIHSHSTHVYIAIIDAIVIDIVAVMVSET